MSLSFFASSFEFQHRIIIYSQNKSNWFCSRQVNDHESDESRFYLIHGSKLVKHQWKVELSNGSTTCLPRSQAAVNMKNG